jgi:hypothetical protein
MEEAKNRHKNVRMNTKSLENSKTNEENGMF